MARLGWGVVTRERSRPTNLRGERGAAAVEFALVVGLLLTLLIGIVQFGRAYSQVVVLTGAAREGARLAAVRESTSVVQTRVRQAAQPYAVNGSIGISAQCSETNQGEPVTVGWTQTIVIDLMLLPPMTEQKRIEAVFRCE
ncbi:MAG: TadE/TadG family type IV pilus assembly protein [Actinomycetota bacterium]